MNFLVAVWISGRMDGWKERYRETWVNESIKKWCEAAWN